MMDKFFTSSYENKRSRSNRYREKWNSFQRKTHEQQAEYIDVLLLSEKTNGSLSEGERYVLDKWEKKHRYQ